MGSKKLKRKKLKVKKLRKFYKSRLIKRDESVLLESCKETGFQPKNITHHRLSEKVCSRSFVEEKDISDLKYFSKVREGYFRNLQRVVSDNCVFWGSVVTEEILEKLALELEQVALLACLQVDIYKKSMLNIIKDIKKCTQEKQMHENVKKFLPESPRGSNLKIKAFPNEESYNEIPKVGSARIDDITVNDLNIQAGLNYNSDIHYSVTDQECTENQVYTTSHHWVENETHSTLPKSLNHWVNEASQKNISNISYLKNFITNQFATIHNFSNSNISHILSEENQNKVDPLFLSRHQLQKSVEQTLNETEKINKQKRDEQEKAYIAQILGNDDSSDDKLNDSLSDNENESKENIDESNLMDRLKKMRELFGMEEESQADVVPEKQKPSNKLSFIINHNRKPTIWKYEKFIQLHKYSIIAAEMTFERRQIKRKIFFELFGEDSDEEHEAEYISTEKFRSSCTERISSWVVKYLMPFYHEKRILGRNVFKSLGHYVSDTIVDKIQYPDEWTVKYLVSKFFPPRKKYVCDTDILNFQLD